MRRSRTLTTWNSWRDRSSRITKARIGAGEATRRTFFTAVTRQAHDAGVTDVGELYRLLVAGGNERIARPGSRYARAALPGRTQQPNVRFDSFGDELRCGGARLHRATEGRGFSIREWVKDKTPGVLFIPYKAGQIARCVRRFPAWMRLAIFEAMNQDGEQEGAAGRRIGGSGSSSTNWMRLGQIDGLKDALARLRKFDGRCVLGFQSIAQVSSTYGRAMRTRSSRIAATH